MRVNASDLVTHTHTAHVRQNKSAQEEIEDSWSLAQLSSKENNLCKIRFFLYTVFFKGIVHPKFQVILIFKHPHVVSNLYEFSVINTSQNVLYRISFVFKEYPVQ